MTIYLPPELHKALRHFAVEHDLEMSDVVTNALREHLPAAG